MLKTGGFISVRCIQGLATLMLVSATVFSFGVDLRAADHPATQTEPERTPGSKRAGLSARPTHPAASRKATTRSKAAEHRTPTQGADELAALKAQLAVQQQQITELRSSLEDQKQLLSQALEKAQARASEAQGRAETASLEPVIAMASATPIPLAEPVLKAPPGPGATPVTQDEMQGFAQKVNTLSKSLDALNKGVAGFRFSGDLRLRSDDIFRSANSVASSQQNARGRYRLRLNVDKSITDQLDGHVQLSTGRYDNPLTYDTDFTGIASRGPIFLSEAWADYHPNPSLDFRGGKVAEVFADNSKFLFDDDVRFNGFQETAKIPLSENSWKLKSIEFRAGQYVLTNPNVQVAPSTKACSPPPQTITISTLPTTITINPPPTISLACAYLLAGFPPGEKVRDSDLFDEGAVIAGDIQEGWSHQFTADFQVWRNPNSIQLGSITAGFPTVINPYYGVSLSGPVTTGLGNATTTAGGAMFTAAHYQVARVAYRIDYKGLKSSRQGFPVYFELQGARNVGTSFARNAWMATLNAGETKKFGDLAVRYVFGYKQANSMISQVTDDDLGTNTGVNLRTHGIFVELGLNKFVVWQNRFYIQNELAANDPTRNFFVTLQKGAGTQYRLQTQLLFSF